VKETILDRAVEFISKQDEARLGKTASLGYVDDCGRVTVCVVSILKTEGLKYIWFSTDLSGRKSRMIQKDHRVGISFYSEADCVSLLGEAEIIMDDDIRKSMWLDWFINHYQKGPTDPEYCLIKVNISHVRLYMGGELAAYDLDKDGVPTLSK